MTGHASRAVLGLAARRRAANLPRSSCALRRATMNRAARVVVSVLVLMLLSWFGLVLSIARGGSLALAKRVVAARSQRLRSGAATDVDTRTHKPRGPFPLRLSPNYSPSSLPQFPVRLPISKVWAHPARSKSRSAAARDHREAGRVSMWRR